MSNSILQVPVNRNHSPDLRVMVPHHEGPQTQSPPTQQAANTLAHADLQTSDAVQSPTSAKPSGAIQSLPVPTDDEHVIEGVAISFATFGVMFVPTHATMSLEEVVKSAYNQLQQLRRVHLRRPGLCNLQKRIRTIEELGPARCSSRSFNAQMESPIFLCDEVWDLYVIEFFTSDGEYKAFFTNHACEPAETILAAHPKCLVKSRADGRPIGVLTAMPFQTFMPRYELAPRSRAKDGCFKASVVFVSFWIALLVGYVAVGVGPKISSSPGAAEFARALAWGIIFAAMVFMCTWVFVPAHVQRAIWLRVLRRLY